jgi:hypothetical protein
MTSAWLKKPSVILVKKTNYYPDNKIYGLMDIINFPVYLTEAVSNESMAM